MNTRIIYLLTVTMLATFASPGLAGLNPVELRCEGMVSPLAVNATPRLSWRVESDERHQVQSAYRILVASSAKLLNENQGDLWDSGKVKSPRSPFVIYAGKKLSRDQVCHWKVCCWDDQGNISKWSKPSTWEVAPLSAADWAGARWIDDGKKNPARDEDFYKPDPAPLMRREFSVTKPVTRARLHVVGLGLCLPSINGQRLSDHAFDPPWTSFDKRVLFRTHDITSQIKGGKNSIGLVLGNGWYNPLPLRMWGHRNIRASISTGRPRAIALLVIEYKDGTKGLVKTDDQWVTTAGPTVRNSIYLGEEYDARKELPGWDSPGFDDSSWQQVRVSNSPLEPLVPLVMPPVRTKPAVAAVAVTTPSEGVHIVDFGQNFTGIPEITLRAPAGTKITFRYGELLNPDGTLNPLTSVCGQIKKARKQPDGTVQSVGGPGAPTIAWQQDVYIAKGGDPEIYRPAFTFHAFRFMEITGLPKLPKASDIVAFPLHTDLPNAGSFSCSNNRLNKIQEICRRTFLSNVVSIQSDCPHRERFAYGGDIVATSEAFLMNFDMAGFYSKTVRDWGDAARADGRFTDTAPFVGIDYCGVGWSMVHPLLLDQLYQHYGCIDLLKEQVPIAIRWFDGEASRRKNGLVTRGLGDHEALVKSRGPELTTAMFVDTARRMARLARLIDLDEDGTRFDRMADESVDAWEKAYLDPATGKVATGTQPAQTFALGFRAAQADNRKVIFDQLVRNLTAPQDGPRLSTGIFGTRILLEELSNRGRSDLAYELANRKTFPSWGYMLENDATTLWEHWAGSDSTFSHNHPMFGSISAWFFRWLGGIQPARDAVGFDRIEIRPQLVADLEWVKCSHQSIRGRIESNWSVDGTQRDFDITIPANTTATIILPSRPGDVLTEAGKAIGDSDKIKLIDSDPHTHRLQVGGGTYHFRLTK